MIAKQTDHESLIHEIDLIYAWAKIPADLDLDPNIDHANPRHQIAELAQALEQARDKIIILEARIAELLSAKKD